jgi:hypothetical protein
MTMNDWLSQNSNTRMGVKNLGDMDRPGNNVAALFTEYVR